MLHCVIQCFKRVNNLLLSRNISNLFRADSLCINRTLANECPNEGCTLNTCFTVTLFMVENSSSESVGIFGCLFGSPYADV